MIVNPEYLTAPKKKGGGVKIHFKIITINITNMTYYPYEIKKKTYNLQFVNLSDYSNIVLITHFLYIKNKHFSQLKKIT